MMTLEPEHARGAARTVTQAFRNTVARRGDTVAVKDLDENTVWSWVELQTRVDLLAGGMVALGVRRGDTVAILMRNRPEFHLVDLGALTAGATPFSIYSTFTSEQMRHLLVDSGTRLIFTEAAFLAQAREVAAQVDREIQIVVVDASPETASDSSGVLDLEHVISLDPAFDGAAATRLTRPDEILTIIYTSGTTGPPKGVQLTHHNMVVATRATMAVTDLPEPGRALSWLPAAHVAERHAHHYLPLMYGLTITTCADPGRLVEALRAARPHWFFAVPRIWEKFKATLEAAMANEPEERREALEASLRDGVRMLQLQQSGDPVPDELAAVAAENDKATFASWRESLGLHETLVLNVGAAPTPASVFEFFHAIGLPVAEIWAMSETSGTGTGNRPGQVRIGTVGTPAPGVEVKLDIDGEILVRSEVVMAGYRNLPDATAEALDEFGWLHTGDLGRLDDGYLTIVGRKKEIMINSAGKNMSPINIESEIVSAHPLIEQVVCVGDSRAFNGALITVDPVFAAAWARQHGLESLSVRELEQHDDLRGTVADAIARANEKLARFEQVRRFAIVPGNWVPGGDELTPTMKLRRKPIFHKYAEVISELYDAPSDHPRVVEVPSQARPARS